MSGRKDESVTAARERKFKASKKRLVPGGAFNVHSADHLSLASMDSAYLAAASIFHWLSLDKIKQPPRQMMDAKFARQVAIAIMVERLRMPQREVARLQRRQRTHIHFALRAVDYRRTECPLFAQAYERAADEAEQRACSLIRRVA